jgi:hypothetical protein
MSKESIAQKVQAARELKEISSSIVSEIKTELGEQAGINAIEAALLKRQPEIMSRMLEQLVANQDFPPANRES